MVTSDSLACRFVKISVTLLVVIVTAFVLFEVWNVNCSEEQCDLATIEALKPWTNYRLSNTTTPLHYALRIQSDVDSGFYNGNVNIRLSVTQSTCVIYLHIKDLQITNVAVSQDSQSIGIRKTFKYPENDYFVIVTNVPIEGDVQLRLDFYASARDKSTGLWQGEYKDGGKMKRMLSTRMEPTFARQMLPCFDEPNKKATFTVKVVAPKQFRTVLSNMQHDAVVQLTNGYTQTTFARSMKMSTYLLAIVICDFDYLEATTADGLIVRTYSRGALLNHTKLAHKLAFQMVQHYGEYFDMPYKTFIAKIDLIVIPDYPGGAMENWGLITAREANMVYNEQSSAVERYYSVVGTVTHELVHMWFGNTVTMDWWNDLWLNEGFATYFSSAQGISYCDPLLNQDAEFVADKVTTGLTYDSYASTHPVRVQLNRPNEIYAFFDAITYSKSASLLRMLAAFIGDKNMRSGLQVYLKRHQLKNTCTDDLWTALSESSGLDVKSIMDVWTNKDGYPYVVYNSTARRLKQTHFEFGTSTPSKQVWDIPIVLSCNNQVVSFLMSTSELSIKDKLKDCPENALVKVNTNFTGFYRVLYDDSGWKNIVKQLAADHTKLSVQDRISLVQDSHALHLLGQVPVSKTLTLIQSFAKNELNHNVVNEVTNSVGYFQRRLRADGRATEKQRTKYDAWAQSLIANQMSNVGYVLNVSQPYNNRTLQQLLIVQSCRFKNPHCIKFMKEQCQKWRTNKHAWFNPDIKDEVLRSVLEFADPAHPNVTATIFGVYDLLMNASNQDSQSALVKAFSAVSDPHVIVDLLTRALDTSKWLSLCKSLAQNDIGYKTVFSYYTTNYAKLIQKYGLADRSLGRLIVPLTAKMHTEEELEKVQSFFKAHPDAGIGKKSRIIAIEHIKLRVQWHKTQLQSLLTYIDKNM